MNEASGYALSRIAVITIQNYRSRIPRDKDIPHKNGVIRITCMMYNGLV